MPDVPTFAERSGICRGAGSSLLETSRFLEAECDLAQAYRVAADALDGEPLTLDEITLLSNDILPGWHEDWVLRAHEAFHLLRVQALEAACRTMAASGSLSTGDAGGAAAIAAEPLREFAAEALINAHLAQRNRYEAMQCFRSLARRLQYELGVAPDPSLTERMVGIAPNQPDPLLSASTATGRLASGNERMWTRPRRHRHARATKKRRQPDIHLTLSARRHVKGATFPDADPTPARTTSERRLWSNVAELESWQRAVR